MSCLRTFLVLPVFVLTIPCAAEEYCPNIIWIVADASRAQNLSCMGNPRDTTPNIDRLAERGVLFENAFAQSNWTTRSVASYFTGRYFPAPLCPIRAGRSTLYTREPDPSERTLPAILRDAGYRTVIVSAHQVYVCPGTPIWDEFDIGLAPVKSDPRELAPSFADINSVVETWLREAPSGEPLFLYVHAVDTHFPHVLDPPYDRWIDPGFDTSHLEFTGGGQFVRRRDGNPYSNQDRGYLQALHDGSLARTDHELGRLLEMLDAGGVLENGLVLFGSDHGEALGEDGRTMEHSNAGGSDTVLHVPLLMAGGGLPEGVRVAQPVENVDIVPTIVDLVGIDTAATFHGESLLPLVRKGAGEPPSSDVFAYFGGREYEDAKVFSLRSPVYKLEWMRDRDQSRLWRVPDPLAQRRNVTQKYPDVVQSMFQRMDSRYLAHWEALRNRPLLEAEIDALAWARAEANRDAVVIDASMTSETHQKDGKWGVSDGVLWAAPRGETPPPLEFRLTLPNGEYVVRVSILNDPDLLGYPASGLKGEFSSKTKRTKRLKATGTTSNSTPYFSWETLGTATVIDGGLTLRIAPSGDDLWTVFRRVQVIPARRFDPAKYPRVDDDVLTDINNQVEALRALGYLE